MSQIVSIDSFFLCFDKPVATLSLIFKLPAGWTNGAALVDEKQLCDVELMANAALYRLVHYCGGAIWEDSFMAKTRLVFVNAL